MEKLTEDQATELYGKVPLLFAYYYKFTFTFSGEAPDGATILVSFGGESDDVYRCSIERDEPMYLDSGYKHISIKKDGETLFEKDDWY